MQHLINVKMKYVKNTEAYLNLKLLHDTPQLVVVGGGGCFIFRLFTEAAEENYFLAIKLA